LTLKGLWPIFGASNLETPRLRRILGSLAVGTLVLVGTAARAEETAPGLQAILAGETAGAIGPDLSILDPGGVLAAVAGLDRFPAACATPLVQALALPDRTLAPPLAAVRAYLVSRPATPGERTLNGRDGRFAVRYVPGARPAGLMAADHDRNGHPDLVDRVAEAVAAALSLLEGRLGYPASAPLAVYLLDLGRGLEGYAVPDERAPFVILDAGLPSGRVMSAVLHQVAHAALQRLAPRSPAWWSEATAAFLALSGSGDLAGHEPALRARLEAAGRSLPGDDLALLPGGLLWPWFLAERAGDPGVVRAVWEEMAGHGTDPLAAADTVLRRSGSSLAEAFREFCLWNLFTGSRDQGLHYPEGHLLPEAPLPSAGPALPVVLGPVEPVEALASLAFRLPAEPRRGSLDVEVRVEGGSPGADLLVRPADDAGGPVLVPVPLDAGGAGRAAVPLEGLKEAWIVLRNGPAASSARFEIRAAHDPYAPYDLAGLVAESVGASIVLQWTTASETGLIGWNIERAPSPEGPFQRLNGVAVPAWGEGTSDTGYVFVDDTARPGRRHYYRIEGLTAAGLAAVSHVVSARLPAR
jgi:hypothetical protein